MTAAAPQLEGIIRFVAGHTGMAVSGRRETFEAGIRRAMSRAGIADPVAYLDLLTRSADALDDLLAELTVGETYFFREPGQFEFLRREVLPEFRGMGRSLRAWSAGCASGEEPYSLAILFEQEGFGGQYHLLATDLCRSALERARHGVYRAWSLRGEGAALAWPYLEAEGPAFRVIESIRRKVIFRPLNLALDAYPSASTDTCTLDLILCRNVLIYLNSETVARVAGRLFESLVPGGWLVTASSDPPLAELAPFEVVVAHEGIFYRRKPVAVSSAPQRQPEKVHSAAFAVPAANTPALTRPARPVVRTRKVPSGKAEDRTTVDLLEEARTALARGDYTRTLELTRGPGADAALAALHVRALANLGPREAEQSCAAAVARHPLSAELSYLHALLLMDLGRDMEAAQALRRVLYLDSTLALAHFTLGSVLERLGDTAGASRAYRNAYALCSRRPAEDTVALAEGGQAGHLAEAAAARLAALEQACGRGS